MALKLKAMPATRYIKWRGDAWLWLGGGGRKCAGAYFSGSARRIDLKLRFIVGLLLLLVLFDFFSRLGKHGDKRWGKQHGEEQQRD